MTGASPSYSSRARGGRLTRSRDFESAYRKGSSKAGRYLVVYGFPRDDESPARVGISVSRKVGGSVVRSRVKRVLKEAFATFDQQLPVGHDFVLVARRDLDVMIERNGFDWVVQQLEPLLESWLKQGGTDG